MPEPSRLRETLISKHPIPWVDHLLGSFEASYFEAFSESAIDRHLGMLRSLSDERPAALAARPASVPGHWEVDVVGYDAFQFLSTLGTLFTVFDLSIVESLIFTSEPPPPPPTPSSSPSARHHGPVRRYGRPGMIPGPPRPSSSQPDRRRRIIDTFLVRQMGDLSKPADWEAIQSELQSLAQLLRDGQFESVFQKQLGRFVAAVSRHSPVHAGSPEEEDQPLNVLVDAEASPNATVVRVLARDSLGFLSLTASALSLCGIRIVRGLVKTPAPGRVDDTFWVTDRAGNKITAEPRLRELRLSLILIEQFSSNLPRAVSPESALIHFSRFANELMTRPNWAEDIVALNHPEVLSALVRVLGESDFLWEGYLHSQTDLVFPIISDPTQWDRPPTPPALAAEILNALAEPRDTAARAAVIRKFKDRELFRTGLRAILEKTDGLEGFARELTDLATVILTAAFRESRDTAVPRSPQTSAGEPVPCALCALGKFGGRELGFGSDLEIMIVYDDRDVISVDPGTFPSDHFDQIVRNLRSVMGIQIGGTFELDFRLRPYGKGGPPATSFSSFREYYQPGGPAWGYERQALIKLRAIAGDEDLGRLIEKHRDQYVFGPEPFDTEGWRRLRSMQIRQLVKPGSINAKFSPGALVETEYITQALQIRHGGQHPAVRCPNTLDALDTLASASLLKPEAAAALRSAYRFYRSLIDALRVVHGHAKDLTVPDRGSIPASKLARRMRLADGEDLWMRLKRHLEEVRPLVEELPRWLEN